MLLSTACQRVIVSYLEVSSYPFPSSSQLRLGFISRKCSFGRFPVIHLRGNCYQMHAFAAIRSASCEGHKNESPWMDVKATMNSFSGWDAQDPENTGHTERHRGILGAGLPCVFVAAGVIFISLSLRQKHTCGLELQLRPLMKQQEEVLSDELNKEVNKLVHGNGTVSQGRRESNPHSEGSNESFPSAIIKKEPNFESNGRTNEGTPLPDYVKINSEIVDLYPFPSSQGELQHNADASDASESTKSSHILTDLPVSGKVDILKSCTIPASDASASFSKLDNSVGTAELTGQSIPRTDSVDTGMNYEESVTDLKEMKNVHTFSEPSSAQAACFSDHVFASDGLIPPQLDGGLGSCSGPQGANDTVTNVLMTHSLNLNDSLQLRADGTNSPRGNHEKSGLSDQTILAPMVAVDVCENEQLGCDNVETCRNISCSESAKHEVSFSHAGIPAPFLASAALEVPPEKVLIPAAFDQVQGQALAALKALKVVEVDAQPTDLCTRREYARWLVSASSILSRSTSCKVYPAMYIQNVTELAFDDVTPEDPDFSSIQGLAEAGLISSKLSVYDICASDGDESPICFSPECPVSRQDLVTWKMTLEKRELPEADKKILYESSGFLDIDKIHPDAWPALIADMSAGELGIVSTAFGYTRLFQPEKPVTKAQVAVALTSGEFSDVINEEIARIEAETTAETAVAAHAALVAEVQKDINAKFQEEIAREREKIVTLEKLVDDARQELARVKSQREDEDLVLVRGRAAVESEMEVLSRLRHEMEEKLEGVMRNRTEVMFERKRIDKLRKETEDENQVITQLQHDLEVERKALSMARAWAEEEAMRARVQAKALEEARGWWESQGLKVVVGDELREAANAGVTWIHAGDPPPPVEAVNECVNIALALGVVEKLKAMAAMLKLRSSIVIMMMIEKISIIISLLKERAAMVTTVSREFHRMAITRVTCLQEELGRKAACSRLRLMDGAERITRECKVVMEKVNQKLKT